MVVVVLRAADVAVLLVAAAAGVAGLRAGADLRAEGEDAEGAEEEEGELVGVEVEEHPVAVGA